MKFLVTLILAALTLECESREPRLIGTRIVGGVEVDIESIPYQIALLNYGFHRCGGSILSCKFVLTAGHCTDGIPASELTVRAGSSQHASGGSIHDVVKVNMHPQYDPSLLDYDASILTLRNLIRFDAARRPIQLPFLNEVLPEGTLVLTTGWGLTQNSNESNANLRMVELKITNQAKCNAAHKEDGGITNRMVCASANGKDSCDGDSGGPLQNVKSKKLVGIVSFGAPGGCAQSGFPGVYTRVAVIRSWIRQIVDF